MSKTNSGIAKEPLIHFTKRDDITGFKSVLWHGVGLLAGLIVCAVFIMLFTGLNPIEVYVKMFQGTFGGEVTRLKAIHHTAILLAISLAVTPAFKMKFWNIGAEGQVLIGALAAAYCMLQFGDTMEEPLLILTMFLTCMVAGMIWAMIPAIFKAIWNTNETLFTLMMNYVAITLVSYFIMVKDRSGRSDLGILNERTGYGYLPKLFGQDYLLNIAVVILITVLIFVYLKFSKQGYEIAVVGESQNTAKYIGINVKKVIIRTMAISGAICGIVGLMLVAGSPTPSLKEDIVGGMGFTAILVSWMAKFNPIIMVFVSALVVFLGDGGASATDALKIDSSVGEVLTAIIRFFIIGCEFFTRYKINFRKRQKGE